MAELEPKCLITGAKGFIGAYVKECLPDADTFDHDHGRDIRNPYQVEAAVSGHNRIIHLAGRIPAAGVGDNEVRSVNFDGTRCLFDAAKNQQVEVVVYASSASAKHPEANGAYGCAKYEIDQLAAQSTPPPSLVGVAYENVYGLRFDYKACGGSIYTGSGLPCLFFYSVAKHDNYIEVIGNGTTIRDYIGVADATKITTEIVNKALNIPSGTVIQVGTGTPVSTNELADLFRQRYNTEIIHLPIAPPRVTESVADLTLLNRYIGKHSFTPITEGFRYLAEIYESIYPALKGYYQKTHPTKNPASSKKQT